jgi:hypothetical protein
MLAQQVLSGHLPCSILLARRRIVRLFRTASVPARNIGKSPRRVFQPRTLF